MPIVRDPLDPRISLWHWLAYELRYQREKQGLSLTQVGQIIGAARSTVSNIEAGRRRLDDDQAVELDRVYDTGLLLQLLLWFARMNHDPDWHGQYTKYELEARIIRVYQGQSMPGPLQTERTIRAMLAESRTIKDLEVAVKTRLARQDAILSRPEPPRILVITDEAALDNEVGGRDVLREQLLYLNELGSRPLISVRVLTRSTGAHVGLDGPIRILSLDSRDIAYVGAQRGGRLVESPAEVRELALDYDLIGLKALPEVESRALIDRKIEALS